MNRVYKLRHFARWMRKTELTDALLCAAVREMSQGLIDADLGAGLIKKRIAVSGRGKSSGFRTLVATNKGGRWLFMFGFSKNERANISDPEKEALQELAQDYLAKTERELTELVADGSLQEICDDHDSKN